MGRLKRGTRAEHRSIALMERNGYRCVRCNGTRAVAVWDVVAIGPDDVVLIRVKKSTWPNSVEMEVMADYPAPPGVRKEIHRWRFGQIQPDVREVE